MEPKAVKILVADDTLIARTGWRGILATDEDVSVIGEAASAQECVTMTIKLKPDILLMDLKWFGDDTAGRRAIEEIKKARPSTQIIAVTAYEELIAGARHAGADAALLKTFGRDDLLQLIHALAKREPDDVRAAEDEPRCQSLTEREYEVLDYVSKGLRNAEICAELGIKLSTVKHHLRNMQRKLSARNRTEAVDRARRMGLFPEGDIANS